MVKFAYLDNGATTKMAQEVKDAMLLFYSEKYGNASSLHSMGQEARAAIEEARKVIAKKINARPEEIIFTSGGTESDNLAIRGAVHASKDKRHIVTSKIEHPAVSSLCKQLEKEGFEVTYLEVDKDGLINLDQLQSAIKDTTALVSLIHGNNEIGTLQDIEEIGKVCKKKGVLFHTDAVQSFTKTEIDTKKIHVDLLSMSAHKIHGPKGIGALYVRKGTTLEPIFRGGKHEFSLRPGTENVPAIIGFAKAVEISGTDDNIRMTELRDYLKDRILNEIDGTHLNGHPEKRLPNNVNITFKYIEGEGIMMHLSLKGVMVSTGSACASKSLEPSPVITALGLPAEDSHGSIRFTLSRYTTKEELDYCVGVLKPIIHDLKKLSPFK